MIISDLHPFVQAEFGPENKWKLFEDQEPLFFPAYHTRTEDYLQAVGAAGAEVLAALDIAMKNEGEVFPGALVVWARKPG